MPLNLFYTMVQKSQKWPKTQIKGGGSCLKRQNNEQKNATAATSHVAASLQLQTVDSSISRDSDFMHFHDGSFGGGGGVG